METVNCICCGSHEYIGLLTNKKDEYKKRIKNLTPLEKETRFVVCKNCGFVYQNPRLEINRLVEFYKEMCRTVSPEKHRPPDIDRQVQWILDNINIPSDKREVLDVGCATGSLLNLFKKVGWNTFGVEPTI